MLYKLYFVYIIIRNDILKYHAIEKNLRLELCQEKFKSYKKDQRLKIACMLSRFFPCID